MILKQKHYQVLVFSALLLIVGLIPCFSPAGHAEEPDLLFLIREDGRQRYTAFCTPVAQKRVKCEFEGIEIMDANIMTEDLKNMIADLDRGAKSLSKEELIEAFKDMCKSQRMLISFPETQREFPPISDNGLQDYESKLSSLCKQDPTTREKAIKKLKSLAHLMLEFWAKIENKCCALSVQRWEMEFHQISENKWINYPEASGMCKIVKVYELVQNSPANWTLTKTRVAGDTESPVCKGVENELMKPTCWTTLGPGYFPLKCDYLKW